MLSVITVASCVVTALGLPECELRELCRTQNFDDSLFSRTFFGLSHQTSPAVIHSEVECGSSHPKLDVEVEAVLLNGSLAFYCKCVKDPEAVHRHSGSLRKPRGPSDRMYFSCDPFYTSGPKCFSSVSKTLFSWCETKWVETIMCEIYLFFFFGKKNILTGEK